MTAVNMRFGKMIALDELTCNHMIQARIDLSYDITDLAHQSLFGRQIGIEA